MMYLEAAKECLLLLSATASSEEEKNAASQMIEKDVFTFTVKDPNKVDPVHKICNVLHQPLFTVK